MPHADIYSIDGIEHAKNLKSLKVGYSRIQSLEPLRDLVQLERIDFHDNMITSVEPLKNLTKLTHMTLSDNYIKDITPLKSLTNLESYMCTTIELVRFKLSKTFLNWIDCMLWGITLVISVLLIICLT